MTSPVKAVEAIGITKRFGPTTALNGAGIAITEGETHALLGRNGAGKSTLVSILTGLQRPDEGEVRFGGQPAPPLADRDAWRQRVACVYQKSTIIPTLTVAENLFLNRQTERGRINWRSLRTRARRLLEQYGVDVDADVLAGDLGVEQRQLVEIARALSFGARFIILDEPTAQLDGPAIQRLFARMRALREQGVTMMFISHHLDEVYEICQSVSVFRDARHIVTASVDDLPHDQLVDAMTGEATAAYEYRTRTVGASAPVVLAARNLRLAGRFEDVDLAVRAGEVVGLAGSGSSGKVGLAETLVGLRKADTGTVTVNGTEVKGGDVPSALAAGLGFVPQDRHHEGFVPLLSIAENATIPIAHKLGRFGMVSPARRRERGNQMIARLDIKTTGPDQPVADLSGGNAQKVVLARALADDPKALVVINPTAGVDVKAKHSLLGAVEDAVDRGAGAVLVSDELDDLRICDRVLIMFHGRIVKDVPRGWTDTELVAAMEGIDHQ
ncbi:simple sugar transport system ATP-binding protein [Streptosporangium becharense]|uniref:Simple sugar transport system ATP-binding protein n=1 Tax=Streptosporangium becharense TaxID=1816182 RepID=A0A7W9IJN1_9ACTN|nr:sugar ABC transporter ATP-binding protein [Streptosporangium becharense]MBB2913991.1 simple sugar transport system ATP-binding protein [Streptosporangium becharense]MBB5821348.1 simple sugar transport system ATP-binding protein [Streptosporangium becharense]